MAKDLSYIIKAVDGYSKELSRAESAFGKASSVITSASKIAAVAAAASLGTMAVATYKAIKAANEQDAAEKQLSTALGYTSQALLNQAAALQKVTTFGDENILQAQASIAMFVKDEEQIKAATKATLDFAKAKEMDLASASDLIAKTLGSTTNALGRYGIEVKGAVGSTERLTSLTKGIAELFGGQAAAAATTFGGKLSQISNAYSDIWEELGFVITRNNFFIQGLEVIKGIFEGTTEKIKENRLWLMELSKSGVITLVSSFKGLVDVIHFVHNGFMGLELVGLSAMWALNRATYAAYESTRLILKPLDLIYQGMVAVGALKTNPFDNWKAHIEVVEKATLETGAGILENIEKSDIAYQGVKKTIEGIEAKLKNIKVEQAAIGATMPKPARIIEDEEATKRAINLQKDLEKTINDVIIATMKLGATQENIIAIDAILFSERGASTEQVLRYMAALELLAKKEEEIAEQKKIQAEFDKLAERNKIIFEREQEKSAIIGEAIEERDLFTEKERAMAEVSLNREKIMSAARANISAKMYQTMNTALLDYIETGKFSIGEFANIMAQQVKIELVGIAAKMAVDALYYTALGFGYTATGNPLAPVAFKAAALFATAATAAGVAAAGVQSVVGGSAKRPAAGEIGGQPIQTRETGGGYKYYDYESSQYGSGWRPGEGQVSQKISGDTYNISIQAVDSKSFEDTAKRNSKALVNVITDDIKYRGKTKDVIRRYV